jgi:hypothetical protein
MVVLLMIGGKLPAQRAKAAHFVGHLPPFTTLSPDLGKAVRLDGVFDRFIQ